jgi:hypothetical protein
MARAHEAGGATATRVAQARPCKENRRADCWVVRAPNELAAGNRAESEPVASAQGFQPAFQLDVRVGPR